MDAFAGIPHEDLLKLVFTVGVLLISARLLGEVARRLGQPAVVGEIMAGVLLGPSLLSGLVPAFGEMLLPATEQQAHLLDAVALIGIVLLMVVVGLETDLGLIKARWQTAVGVGLGGLVVPFGFGLLAGLWIPDRLLGSESRLIFALFLATALALSAIPVLAKILSDLSLLRRSFGQTALAAGMIDDIVGWAILGVVVSLASSGTMSAGTVLVTIGSILLFFALTVAVARPLVTRALGWAIDRSSSRDMALTMLVAFAFLWGAFSQWLHLEPILGAFAIGVLFGQLRRLPVDAVTKLESVTNSVFAPIFLATAGLRLRLDLLLELDLALLCIGLLIVAAIGKLAGGLIGGFLVARVPWREALGYGIALNARGVLGVVVATIGLSMGIFGPEVYSMVVVVSLVTSLVAPVGLRWATKNEDAADVSAAEVGSFRRILMPVRVRDGGEDLRRFEASVLSAVGTHDGEVSVVAVLEDGDRRNAERYLRTVAARFDGLRVRNRVVKGNPRDVILDMAGRGYDLLALGGTEPLADSEYLFGSMVDDLVRMSPCPTAVFRSGIGEWPPRSILVPTSGSAASGRAARLAFDLAAEETTVVLFHVVDPDLPPEAGIAVQTTTMVRLDAGHDIVTNLRRLGEDAGVRVTTEVVMGGSMASQIVDRAGDGIDLMVVGTSARAGTQRLFLGPKVERILNEVSCPTIVLNL